jgi:hypothetical protein
MSTITRIITAVALSSVLFAAAPTASLAAEKKEKAEKKEGKAKAAPYAGELSAVDKSAKTVTIKTKNTSRVYQINAETRITKAGKPATLDDATVGEPAAAYGTEVAGKYVAQSLRLGAKVDDAPKSEAKPKKKKDGDKK